MKLIRPKITPSKWTVIENSNPSRFAKGWREIWSDQRKAVVCVSSYESSVHGTIAGVQISEEDAKVLSMIPEVMDRLEWVLELLTEEDSHPMTRHELIETMLKMGYTQAPES